MTSSVAADIENVFCGSARVLHMVKQKEYFHGKYYAVAQEVTCGRHVHVRRMTLLICNRGIIALPPIGRLKLRDHIAWQWTCR